MRRRRSIGILLLCAFWLCSCQSGEEQTCALEIICLDVGQGDCTLLRTREGDILIDAGPESSQEALCVSFDELGVNRLNLAVFTNADENYIGGADGVLRDHPAEQVWFGGKRVESDSFLRMEDAFRVCGIVPQTVCAGDFIQLGGVTVTVLAPFRESSEGNAESLVLSVQAGSFSMLFPGDTDAEAEGLLMRHYPSSQLSFTVLHAGHHGSNSAGTPEFLSLVSPEAVIISCGAGNSYGYPDGRTLARLESTGASIYRTDLVGEIHIRTDGEGYEVVCKK